MDLTRVVIICWPWAWISIRRPKEWPTMQTRKSRWASERVYSPLESGDSWQKPTDVYLGPPRLPQQSIPYKRGRINMPLKITDREVDGVAVLALDGRIVLGEETLTLRDK